MRLVVSPTGDIVPDIDARLPGRGLWLSARRDIVERAVAKRLFARAARRSVAAPADLADRIEALLARRCCEALGLARRAGLAVAGFERVSEAVRGGRNGLLLFALDGAEGGQRKLGALGRDLPVARALYGAELGAVFGRERSAHVWVGPGPLCRRLLLDVERIAGFRAEAAVDRGVNVAPARPVPEDGGSATND